MKFFIFIGEGGTGKTFLINLLSQWSEIILQKAGNKSHYPKTIRLAATGNAAHLIGKQIYITILLDCHTIIKIVFFISDGTTFHAGLRFKWGNEYAGMTDEVLDSLRRQFEDMALVIIDEMSLVGADFLYHLHKRFVEVCRNQDVFGNKAMLLVGDLLQIPPTQQKSIFDKPKSLQNQALYNSSENLWESFQTVTLLVNKRQGVSEWRNTLSRVRVGGMNIDDEKLIESRRVSNDQHKDKNFDDALHLFYSNDEVCKHNEARIAKLPDEPKNVKADIRGYPKGCQPKIKYDSFVEETRMQKMLTIKKGARVIHNFNVDIIDGLVNGVTGTVIGFSYRTPSKSKENLAGANISSCIVKFDDHNV